MTNTISKSISTNRHYLVREPKVTSVRTRAIILLHGVGSNEQDLLSLADRLPDDFMLSLLAESSCLDWNGSLGTMWIFHQANL